MKVGMQTAVLTRQILKKSFAALDSELPYFDNSPDKIDSSVALSVSLFDNNARAKGIQNKSIEFEHFYDLECRVRSNDDGTGYSNCIDDLYYLVELCLNAIVQINGFNPDATVSDATIDFSFDREAEFVYFLAKVSFSVSYSVEYGYFEPETCAIYKPQIQVDGA
jgi:hypothetical protein